MRRVRVQWGLWLVLVLGPVTAGAQVPDTLGVPDTLYFGHVEASPGRSVKVPIRVANDFPLVSMTIPVSYPKDRLSADSASFAGGRAGHFDFHSTLVDPARGRLVVEAVDPSGDVMPAGSGAIAWLHFKLSDRAVPGEVIPLDTGYFNDPTSLLFVAAAEGENPSLIPVVQPGSVTVVEENRPPRFLPVSPQTVREGETLAFSVYASDPDDAPVTILLVNRPPGAVFTETGPGEAAFSFVPPFTGPYASGPDPLILRFSADDGEDATIMDVPVVIVNVNRPPVLSVPDSLTVPAYDSLNWNVQAWDPDLEPVTLSVSGLPDPAQVSPGNPLTILWQPVQADTGTYSVTIRAEDGNGGIAEDATVLRVSPAQRVDFLIDTVSGYNDQDVVLQIHMRNREAIAGFELLFHLDPTAVAIYSVDPNGTRIADWEMFAVDLNYNGSQGDVRVVARADINDDIVTPPLEEGEGPVVSVRLRLAENELFAGLSFPVRFVFTTATANTALDAGHALIYQDEIEYTHGSVLILLYEGKLTGDINLNGLPYEVGDVVYFANYFSNPGLYPLSFEQRANSDINGDGTPATIADLVYMINILLGGGLARPASVAARTAEWELDSRGELHVTADGLLGGAFLRVASAAAVPRPGPALDGMTILQAPDESGWRLVAYSLTGASIDPARGALVEGLDGAEITALELADVYGGVVAAAARATLPAAHRLLGNYPNPFNPATAIRFRLQADADVTVGIYNVLGARVKTLEGRFPAGEHELVWRGDDESGHAVGTGVYFYRFEAGAERQTGRMLLLK